jgi:hypothetical protein
VPDIWLPLDHASVPTRRFRLGPDLGRIDRESQVRPASRSSRGPLVGPSDLHSIGWKARRERDPTASQSVMRAGPRRIETPRTRCGGRPVNEDPAASRHSDHPNSARHTSSQRGPAASRHSDHPNSAQRTSAQREQTPHRDTVTTRTRHSARPVNEDHEDPAARNTLRRSGLGAAHSRPSGQAPPGEALRNRSNSARKNTAAMRARHTGPAVESDCGQGAARLGAARSARLMRHTRPSAVSPRRGRPVALSHGLHFFQLRALRPRPHRDGHPVHRRRRP